MSDGPQNTERLQSTLSAISGFIGTHGLAVFLVVFYAVVIYPQSQKERSDWIEQITRVRLLVDPGTRPLSIPQADAVYRIVIESFSEKLRNIADQEYGIGRRFALAGQAESLLEERRYVYLFGEEIAMDFQPSDKSAGVKEISRVFSRATEAITDRRRSVKEEMERSFQLAERSNSYAVVQLERLRLENSTLEVVWKKAFDETKTQWLAEFDNALLRDDRYQVKRFLDFAKLHPFYESWIRDNASTVKTMQSFQFKAFEETISNIRSSLELHISRQIKPQVGSGA